MTPQQLECDVLIIGAGMAGSCLARQLKLDQSDLRIMNIDKRTRFDYWIGESTVEAWEDYLVRRLGLGHFLQAKFPEKHGLRMFFDSAEKDLPIAEMSEFGRSCKHAIPARHIDRSVFDTEMAAINKANNIDVRLGVSVSGRDAITLDREGGHVVPTSIGDIKCRWLIDAAGRSSPLARQLNLVEKDTRHPSASYWVRIKGANHIDDLGRDDWRGRVNHTRRYASTNHFLYDGYWFWLISLSQDVISLGIEFDPDKHDLPVRSQDEFLAFTRTHKCLDELLGDSCEVLDFKALTYLPRCAKQHFSRDRWFLTGMSGWFAEVIGSGTSRVYSENNRIVGELIKSDRAGDTQLLERQIEYFNRYMSNTFRAFQNNLSLQYHLFGSFDIFSNYFGIGLALYFNRGLPNCITDLQVPLDKAAHCSQWPSETPEETYRRVVLDSPRTATCRLANEFCEFLQAKGAYHANNRGMYADSLFWEERPDITPKTYRPRCAHTELQVDRRSYEFFFRRLLRRMCELEGVPFDEDSFVRHYKVCWLEKQTLGEMLAIMAAPSDRRATTHAM